MRFRIGTGWVLGVVVLLSQCATKQPMLNVILIVADTLRADHLGSYGYKRATSPNLDQFARENLLFLNNRSQAACTFPSVNSLLTSRFTTEFYGKYMGIPAEMAYLPAILNGYGYRTIAVSASPIIRNKPSRFNPDGGFGRGFDTFVPGLAWASAEQVNQEVLKSLSPAKEPFFLYLHYIDPHGPYDPPADYTRQFGKAYDGPEFILAGKPTPIEAMLYESGPKISFTAGDIQHLVDLYDDEIAYFDHWFGELLDTFKRKPWWENTLVIFVSDHGEAFLENGHIKHCRCLYETQTHVPLMLKLPKEQVSGVRGMVTQNLDVVPTILDMIGVPYEELGFAGTSLRPLFDPDNGKEFMPYAFSAQSTQRSINTVENKLIIHLESGKREFYNLLDDPNELNDLADQNPEKLQELATAFTQWLEENQLTDDLEASKASQELLRSLGYIQ